MGAGREKDREKIWLLEGRETEGCTEFRGGEGLMRGRRRGKKKRGMDEKGKHMEDGEVGMRTVREISWVL